MAFHPDKLFEKNKKMDGKIFTCVQANGIRGITIPFGITCTRLTLTCEGKKMKTKWIFILFLFLFFAYPMQKGYPIDEMDETQLSKIAGKWDTPEIVENGTDKTKAEAEEDKLAAEEKDAIAAIQYIITRYVEEKSIPDEKEHSSLQAEDNEKSIDEIASTLEDNLKQQKADLEKKQMDNIIFTDNSVAPEDITRYVRMDNYALSVEGSRTIRPFTRPTPEYKIKNTWIFP